VGDQPGRNPRYGQKGEAAGASLSTYDRSEHEPLLRVRRLRTWFRTDAGTVRAVDGMDLDVERGRTTCLVGESGCGKSVAGLSIVGLIDPPGFVVEGSHIGFQGRELVGLPDRELDTIRGELIGMVFQEPMSALNPVQTVGDQIGEGLRLHRGWSKKAARRRAVELLDHVGIPDPGRRAGAYPHQLSGGMRQRVVIAMAIACEPQLLIADEPTTALDVTVQAQILELLDRIKDESGMAILHITHDLGVVAQVADHVAVAYGGRVVEEGPPGAVLSNPQHPYTEALLQSMPVLGMSKERRLRVIRGMVPGDSAWPEGCRFAPRCDYGHDRCTTYPEMMSVGYEHRAACWLCEHGGRSRETQGDAV